MNTGWVDESYNDVIEDIMMSEDVAVLIGTNWVAANPTRGTVEYQKSINVGVIVSKICSSRVNNHSN